MSELSDRISLKTLGSSELHSVVVADIEELMSMAQSKDMVPKMLVVGDLFVELACVQSLIQELNIKSWEKEIREQLEVLSELVRNKKLMVYQLCESKSGKFGDDASRGLEIFFDPDEPYMSLKCIDPSSAPAPGDFVTKDGFLIVSLHYKEEEILVDFQPSPEH